MYNEIDIDIDHFVYYMIHLKWSTILCITTGIVDLFTFYLTLATAVRYFVSYLNIKISLLLKMKRTSLVLMNNSQGKCSSYS